MFSHFSNLPSMSVWGIFIASIFSTNTAFAQDRFAKVQITTQAIANNVYMLVGSGGNIGVAGSNGSGGGGSSSGGSGGAIGHYWHRNASLSGSGAWTFTNNGTATGTTAN